ncbi:hypothetical protein ACTMTI_21820 [Nonomuraea sp. H19]|uniref:hypothetical protein n=1 Tax=Nonomuraea sp. H19 TaxID=3452206 RepID=UPI003F8AB7D6
MSNFEDRLLSALKEEITTRTAEDNMTTTVTPVQRGSRRRLLGLSAAAAGLATATTAVVALTGIAGSPAYAVTKGSDGAVSVRIESFTDPEGLEAELADAGVKAVVDYLPFGQTCKSPRGEPGSLQGQFAVSMRKEGDGISFTIEKGQVPEGETLVLAVSQSRDGSEGAPFGSSLEVVKGAVADCEPTAMPAPGSPRGRGGDSGFHTKNDDGTNTGPSTDSVTE